MTERILFVDDEKAVLDGYRRALRGRYRCDMVTGAAEALKLVHASGPYAVVVADMKMPGMSGMELLANMKELAPDTVRIMVTGNADQKTAVDAVNKGAVYRFLNKPCKRETLSEALDEALAKHARAVGEREQLARTTEAVDQLTERLSYESRHDVLTGLLNRTAFEQGLRESLSMPSPINDPEHVLCHLDLDHFHVINDTYGQTAGDAMLRAVGDLLSAKCRVNDLVARLAGDEFGILFVDCTLNHAERAVQDICHSLTKMAFEWGGRQLEIGASAGLVPVSGRTQDAMTLINSAETACAFSKEHSRGQLHIAEAGDATLTARTSQAEWVARIGDALREDRFRLFCQRIVPIDDGGSGEHYELLIRMLDERGDLVSPGEFLDAAERYHLSPRIDRWVISAAVDWLSANPECRERITMCSINLSGLSLGDPEVLSHIHRVFEDTPVSPENICFEITETAAIARLSNALAFIRELKDRGFRFSLDDFGSGLSSFGYLKNLPVDYLKIDGAFVKHIDSDAVDRAMVRCINEVAQVMGKKTIAEYVENAEILQRLREIGVSYAQGFHIAAPHPIEQIRDGSCQDEG